MLSKKSIEQYREEMEEMFDKSKEEKNQMYYLLYGTLTAIDFILEDKRIRE